MLDGVNAIDAMLEQRLASLARVLTCQWEELEALIEAD